MNSYDRLPPEISDNETGQGEDASTDTRATLRRDVIAGLSAWPKTLPCRWLYDEKGSRIFEEITRQPEYYPTRTETSILSDRVEEISTFVGSRASVLEYGAGAAIKTEILINGLDEVQSYVPIDISADFLHESAARLRKRFPGLDVLPAVSDFTSDFDLPPGVPEGRRVAFFPGSTIGNLGVDDAGALLRRMRTHVGDGGAALIGVDLKKSLDILLPAYDDAAGVTAEFNLNLLYRINAELGADFEPLLFNHHVHWNEEESAIEMHLVSLVDQRVTVSDQSFHFRAGESIHTESCRKYDVHSFAALVAENGWLADRHWSDGNDRYALFGLVAADASPS